MRSGSTRRGGTAGLVAALLCLGACAGPGTTAPPAAQGQAAAEAPLQGAVRQLLANQAAGLVRTIGGVGFVKAPIAVPLANGEISLIPLTPDLEATLARLQRRWLAGRRQPLPYEAFQTAFAVLTKQRVAVGRAGGEALIRFAPTDDSGRFTFNQVPEGQWLLVADMNAPVSILLWAVPLDVGPLDQPALILQEGNLLLEARRPDQASPDR